MTTNISLGIAMSLLASFLSAQPLQRCTVVDQDSGEPVAYASVHVAGQPQHMTLSNEDGSFSLPFTAPADTLVFSHVFYGQPRLAVAAIVRDTLRLPARDFTLDEVSIVSETGESILRKVIKAVKDNHDFNNTPYFSQSWKTISSLDRSVLHGFFELDGFVLHRNFIPRQEFAELQSRTRAWTELGEAWLEEQPLYLNHWLNFQVGGGRDENVLNRPGRAKEFDVKISGSYQEGTYIIMQLELTPKRPSCNLRYTLHIDLDSYAVIRFRAQPNLPAFDYQGRCENYEFYEYEERFVEIDGTWHRLYLKTTNKRSFRGQDLLEEEFNLAQLADWDAPRQEKAEPFTSLITDKPVTAFQIPWDDPYWQSRPSVPLPDWVIEQLEGEKVTR